MTGIKCPVLLVVVTCLWMSGRGDTDLSCVFMERCILPCSFQASDDLVIHWYQTDNDYPVHSYYNSQDQLGHQNQRFRGRTSLFKDEISRGNASLQLTGVEVQDEGRYKCYTSTTYGKNDSYINLNVDALVRKVDIEQVGNRIHCSSEGIYPEPDLTWSTRPPSTVTFENTTTVQQTEQRLYSISSSLIVSESVTGLDYICTVSTHTNRRTATVFKRSPISTADSETTIQCTSTNSPLTGLVWRFNHSQTILTRTGPDGLVNVSEGWEHHVKSVSESGSLTLQKLSSNHEGVYTCELSGAEQTTVTSTFLRIDTETSHNRGAIVGGVIGFVVLGVVCLLC